MSIKVVRPRSAKGVLEILTSLATSDLGYVFRGHQSSTYRLQSTLMRFRGNTIVDDSDDTYDHMLHRFENGLARIGKLPPEIKTRQDRLEYARHYGLPSPCIDLSYSPYVALFFALSGLTRETVCTTCKHKYAAVYAISVDRLAHR